MQNGRGRYIIVYWCYLLAIICVAAMKQGYYKGKSLLAMSGSEYPDVTSSNIRLQYTKMKVHGVWKCNPNRPTKFDEKMLFYAPLVWLSIQVWSSIIYLDTWFTWIVENEMQRALSDGYVVMLLSVYVWTSCNGSEIPHFWTWELCHSVFNFIR